MEVRMQSPRISLVRGLVAGLALAALGACSDPGMSSGPSGPGPTAVRVSYCTGLAPTWVAVQDGDGPWTRVPPIAAGANTAFEHTFQTDRGAIARLTGEGGGMTVLSVLYGAPAELATAGFTTPFLCGDPVSKTLIGTVAGLDSNETALVSEDLSSTRATPARQGHFMLDGLASGPHDLVAARTTEANGQASVTGIILRRDVDLPDSATLPALDFTSAEAFLPATPTLTIAGLGPEGASFGVRLLTRTSEILLLPGPAVTHDVARPYPALPTAQLRPEDLQELVATARAGQGTRSAAVYFRSPADRTLTLPAALVRPTFTTVATAPFLRPRAQFLPQADYDREATVIYQQGSTTSVVISMTAAYAALTAGGYDLVVPDLSGASGFDPAWALHPGTKLLWSAVRIGGTLGLGAEPPLSDGATRRDAFDSDSIPGQ
jgi:hypothetical protein